MSDIGFIEDEDGYSARACGIVVDIKLAIEDALNRANLSEEQVTELVHDITFRVCNVLDAGQEMIFYDGDEDEYDEHKEKPLIPILCFFKDEDRDTIIFSSEGSSMHENINFGEHE